MKTLRSRTLVENPDGRLYMVEGEADGRYTVYRLNPERLETFDRKWQAAQAVSDRTVI